MTPEAFARALVAAARQVADDPPADRHATVRRIHESLARRRRGHRRRASILAALAAALFGSTALAWYAGLRLPRSAARAPLTMPPSAPIVTPRPPSPASAPDAPEAEAARLIEAIQRR